VEVTAVITDKRGQPVTGLTKDDFELRENGKPQAISFFSAGGVGTGEDGGKPSSPGSRKEISEPTRESLLPVVRCPGLPQKDVARAVFCSLLECRTPCDVHLFQGPSANREPDALPNQINLLTISVYFNAVSKGQILAPASLAKALGCNLEVFQIRIRREPPPYDVDYSGAALVPPVEALKPPPGTQRPMSLCRELV
jgi:hypothetical protein